VGHPGWLEIGFEVAEMGQFRRYLGVAFFCGRVPLPIAGVQWRGKNAQFRICTKFERKSIAVVMIRLARVGATKKPYYRVVVIEKDRARNGRSIEVVGTYNPRTEPATVALEHERIQYWVSKGAQLSDRVAKLVAKFPAAEPVAA
jgi:small subunit ribosomal protein S16